MIDKITITLEEYKELLIIKGKYEELKSQKKAGINPIVWREKNNSSELSSESERYLRIKEKAKPRNI